MADELQGSDSWQRARRPSQKRSREQSILNACKELISSIHPSDLNTSMIAKEAEISPSGLYRYYPTKESILFALYCQDLENFSLRIRKTSKIIETKFEFAQHYCECLFEEPRLSLLMSILGSTIEREIPVDFLIEFKVKSFSSYDEIADFGLHHGAVQNKQEGIEMIWDINFYVMGLYPIAHGSENVNEAMKDERLGHYTLNFEEKVRDYVRRLTLSD